MNMEDPNYAQRPGVEASSVTPGTILRNIMPGQGTIDREIKEVENFLVGKKDDYVRLLNSKQFISFLNDLKDLSKEPIKNPIMKDGAVHPALAGSMTASELALFYQGYQAAFSKIFEKIEQYSKWDKETI